MRNILSPILTDYFNISFMLTGMEWLDKAFHVENLVENYVIGKKTVHFIPFNMLSNIIHERLVI